MEYFNEEHHSAVEALCDFYSKTAVAVCLYVDTSPRKRVKNIHRFVNMMRVKLSATKEMAVDGEPTYRIIYSWTRGRFRFQSLWCPLGRWNLPSNQPHRKKRRQGPFASNIELNAKARDAQLKLEKLTKELEEEEEKKTEEEKDVTRKREAEKEEKQKEGKGKRGGDAEEIFG